MAKDFWKIYTERYREEPLPIHDCVTEKLSCWTYADMDGEFDKSMEIFSRAGFSDKSAELAWRCVKLSCWPGEEKADSTTENAMAITLFFKKAFEANEVKSIYSWNRQFGRCIDQYRAAPTHGLVLSPEEQAEFDRDIDEVAEKLCNSDIKNPWKDIEILKFTKFSPQKKCPLWDKMREILPPADSDDRTKARLSERAYAMMTEYKRNDKIADPDFFDNELLRPNGLKLTDKLFDFIEIYDGRIFAWKDAGFNMNQRYSGKNLHNGFGISVLFGGPILISGDKYYINAMDWHVAGDWGPYVGSDGTIYYFRSGAPMLAADSMEEFLEEQALEYYKDTMLLNRRRELENKYLIPEIRTASM